jgi:hypothetical protein
VKNSDGTIRVRDLTSLGAELQRAARGLKYPQWVFERVSAEDVYQIENIYNKAKKATNVINGSNAGHAPQDRGTSYKKPEASAPTTKGILENERTSGKQSRLSKQNADEEYSYDQTVSDPKNFAFSL